MGQRGAWLTIGGQRVDFLYRSLDHMQRVIAEAEAGRYELDYAQQPPFGFFSGAYLGEIAVGIPRRILSLGNSQALSAKPKAPG